MTQQRSSATDQLAFWQGQFGDNYTERNAPTDESIRARISAWSGILKGLAGAPPDSILEVGANLGLNLAALRAVTDATLYAVEPNGTARDRLASAEILPSDRILDASAASIGLADAAIDLVFTSGVLIHIAPENLLAAYREMHRVARRYLVTIEYFSDKEEIVPYRGHEGQLFKRDFGAIWLDTFDDVELIDYGFFWKRATGLDNLTWWLFRKR